MQGAREKLFKEQAKIQDESKQMQEKIQEEDRTN